MDAKRDTDNYAEQIRHQLKFQNIYLELKEDMYKKFSSSKLPLSKRKDILPEKASNTKNEQRLRLLVMQLCRASFKSEPIKVDKNAKINQARQEWTEIMLQQLIAHSNTAIDQMNSKATKSNKSEEKLLLQQEESQKLEEKAIWDCTQFLQFICNVDNTASSLTSFQSYNKISTNSVFETGSIVEYKALFGEAVNSNLAMLGESQDDLDLVVEKEKMADQLLKNGFLSELEVLLRTGVPTGKRAQVYNKVFGLASGTHLVEKYNIILRQVGNQQYLIDELIKEDTRVIGSYQYLLNQHLASFKRREVLCF